MYRVSTIGTWNVSRISVTRTLGKRYVRSLYRAGLFGTWNVSRIYGTE